jgi:hypothetical protein
MKTVQLAGPHRPKERGDVLVGIAARRRADLRMNLHLPGLPVFQQPKVSTLAWIAGGLFAYEGLIRRERITGEEPLEILVPGDAEIDASSLTEAVESILRFTLDVHPPVRVRRVTSTGSEQSTPASNLDFDSVALFSGGTDSVCGIAEAKALGLAPIGVSVTHSGGTVACVQTLVDSTLSHLGVPCVRAGLSTEGGWRLQQLRGVLYTTIGGLAAITTSNPRLIISESGPTMFLPRFAPLDDVTLTTNPYVLSLTTGILKSQFGRRCELIEPYSKMTKAESVASCRVKDAIPNSHSCGDTRFVSHPRATHCGVCFGCIIRRTACLVAEVDDARYASDPLCQTAEHLGTGWRRNQRVSVDKFSEVMAVLIFARRILEDKLPASIRLHLESHGVEDLFRRLAMDILSGLYLLEQKPGLRNPVVNRFYRECLRDGIISQASVEARLSDVRGGRFRPDFSIGRPGLHSAE